MQNVNNYYIIVIISLTHSVIYFIIRIRVDPLAR